MDFKKKKNCDWSYWTAWTYLHITSIHRADGQALLYTIIIIQRNLFCVKSTQNLIVGVISPKKFHKKYENP